ncbi:hypothetical protein GCM10010521_19310 [Streptomyces rameus]|uniref:Uncharacterized protein n=1 Tax=Streptomyces rameus TaxID=68261 RepID=A0ABP6N2C3_9ACTN
MSVVRPRGAIVPKSTEVRPPEERPLWPWVVTAAAAAGALILLVNLLPTA